jgi:hypothetical protein
VGDFAPFELAHGEAKLFWGARCRHHTVPNDSGASWVSLDFRVLPSSRFEVEPPSTFNRRPPTALPGGGLLWDDGGGRCGHRLIKSLRSCDTFRITLSLVELPVQSTIEQRVFDSRCWRKLSCVHATCLWACTQLHASESTLSTIFRASRQSRCRVD